jgi:hypothetical protein
VVDSCSGNGVVIGFLEQKQAKAKEQGLHTLF